MYHNFRSQKAVSLLSKFGVGISYDHVTGICNTIAKAISQNIRKHGVYVPSAQQEDPHFTGQHRQEYGHPKWKKGTFHGTALGVLAQCNIFKGSGTEPDSHGLTGRMFKLISKEILPDMSKRASCQQSR